MNHEQTEKRDAPRQFIGAVCAELLPRPLPLSYRHEENDHHFYDGIYHDRQRTPGADVNTCFGGQIAANAMRLF